MRYTVIRAKDNTKTAKPHRVENGSGQNVKSSNKFIKRLKNVYKKFIDIRVQMMYTKVRTKQVAAYKAKCKAWGVTINHVVEHRKSKALICK